VCVYVCVHMWIRVCACMHIHTRVYTRFIHAPTYLCTHLCRFVGSKQYPAAFYHCTSLAQLADLVLYVAN
jgi:hypothetical protein